MLGVLSPKDGWTRPSRRGFIRDEPEVTLPNRSNPTAARDSNSSHGVIVALPFRPVAHFIPFASFLSPLIDLFLLTHCSVVVWADGLLVPFTSNQLSFFKDP